MTTRKEINVTAYGTPKKLEDLGAKECHWPIGESPNIVFCGGKAEKGVYCEAHTKLSKGKNNATKHRQLHEKR